MCPQEIKWEDCGLAALGGVSTRTSREADPERRGCQGPGWLSVLSCLPTVSPHGSQVSWLWVRQRNPQKAPSPAPPRSHPLSPGPPPRHQHPDVAPSSGLSQDHLPVQPRGKPASPLCSPKRVPTTSRRVLREEVVRAPSQNPCAPTRALLHSDQHPKMWTEGLCPPWVGHPPPALSEASPPLLCDHVAQSHTWSLLLPDLGWEDGTAEQSAPAWAPGSPGQPF